MSNKRFTLRIDEELFNKIKEEAENNKRSISAHIEFLLEQHVKKKSDE